MIAQLEFCVALDGNSRLTKQLLLAEVRPGEQLPVAVIDDERLLEAVAIIKAVGIEVGGNSGDRQVGDVAFLKLSPDGVDEMRADAGVAPLGKHEESLELCDEAGVPAGVGSRRWTRCSTPTRFRSLARRPLRRSLR